MLPYLCATRSQISKPVKWFRLYNSAVARQELTVGMNCPMQVGLNFDDVRMAVLVQRVVPANYAFVIHTRNPSNNDENEVFCEMVGAQH